eukprot:11782455-Ditylum_brightwellii.AAC.1
MNCPAVAGQFIPISQISVGVCWVVWSERTGLTPHDPTLKNCSTALLKAVVTSVQSNILEQ